MPKQVQVSVLLTLLSDEGFTRAVVLNANDEIQSETLVHKDLPNNIPTDTDPDGCCNTILSLSDPNFKEYVALLHKLQVPRTVTYV